MRKSSLLAELAIISALFTSQGFAASGCVSAACDPVVAAATACEPAAAAAAPDSAANCNTGCQSEACSAEPLCSNLCQPQGCLEFALGNLKKSLCENICWSGYVNAGYDTNFAGDRSNGLVDAWNNTTPALNAVYISAVKKAFTGGYGAAFGFGVDFMFGEDSRIFRSARGLDQNWFTGHMYNPATGAYDRPSYGFAMPQLYMEAAINNWSVKLGHFYGLLGYEGATAPSRFFYTKGLTCAASPVSQTGVLATYNGFENLDITLGWVNGWNNGFDNSRFNDGMASGSFTYRMNPAASIQYSFQAGTADMAAIFAFWGPYNWGHTKGVGSLHTAILDVYLDKSLESVTIVNYTDFGQATYSENGTRVLVVGEHLYYTINSCWKAGFRAEWLKNTDYIGGSSQDTEVTSFTLGLNWHPGGNQNLYIRPELRYDRATGVWKNQPLNGRPDQFTIGFDVMLTF
ncbi:MAG: outer membrane beta-barrel protein [Thermoguttaceae bacterium]|nr:outer membrane beta-barrel protein [Thermoguttaceae bacterium]